MSEKVEGKISNSVKRRAPHIKILASYHWQRGKVTLFNIVMNTTGNHTVNAVDTIDHALTLWNTACEIKVFLHNQYTDAGRGGTHDDLYRKLNPKRRINDTVETYFVATCSLHGLNLTLSVPVEELLGKGGI